MGVSLPGGIKPHAEAGGDADEEAIKQAEEAFFHDEAAFFAIAEIAEGEAAKGDGEGLAAGVAGLTGEDGEEGGEEDDAVEGVLEDGDDGGGHEAGEEIDLKPRMTVAEAAEDGGGEAFFVFDTDHGAGLGADLDRAGFEEVLATDKAEEASVGVADGIDGEVAVDGGTHGGGEFHFGLEPEDVLGVHDFAEELIWAGEEEVAHDEDAEEAILVVGDVAVGDEGFLGEAAEAFDGLCDGHLRAENADGGFHEPSDAVFGVGLVAHPLTGFFDWSGGEDFAALLVLHFLEDLLGDHGVEEVEGFDGRGGSDFLEGVGGFVGGTGLQEPEEFGRISLVWSHGGRVNPTGRGRN